MDILKPLSLSKTNFCSVVPPCSPYRPSHHCLAKFRNLNRHARLHLLLTLAFRTSNDGASVISEHLRGGSRRRNSLREKLVDEAQVRIKEDFSNSDLDTNCQYRAPHQGGISLLETDNVNSEASAAFGSEGGQNEASSEDGFASRSQSPLWRQLESWVDQCKQDAEHWGIGSSPIFTVYQNSDGGVERVVVNEDEIAKRTLWSLKLREVELDGLDDVNSKISKAKVIAREIETGKYMIPRNSAIAKFVIKGRKPFQIVVPHSIIQHKDSNVRVGLVILSISFVFWAIKTSLVDRNDRLELTREEEEMLRRKMRVRMEREKEKSKVEVLEDNRDIVVGSIRRPKLDKNELRQNILKAKLSKKALTQSEQLKNNSENASVYDHKIRQIQDMARHARELDSLEGSQRERAKREFDSSATNLDATSEHDHSGRDLNMLSLDCSKVVPNGKPARDDTDMNPQLKTSLVRVEGEKVKEKVIASSSELQDGTLNGLDPGQERVTNEPLDKDLSSQKIYQSMKPKIIKSLKEAREFLSKRKVEHIADSVEPNEEASQIFNQRKGSSEFLDVEQASNPDSENVELGLGAARGSSNSLKGSEASDDVVSMDTDDSEEKADTPDVSSHLLAPSDVPTDNCSNENVSHATGQKRIEEKFEELEPIINKIGVGFKENYLTAKEKAQSGLGLSSDFSPLKEDYDDLEWMKDECLRDVVFRVRENELAGRDPFHMINEKEKNAFFKGLEKEVERKNSELLDLHEWIHSRIENLDYGADGISLDDPPEKFIPRWKGPPVDKDPEFLKNFIDHRKQFFSENHISSQNSELRIVKGNKGSIGKASSSDSQEVGDLFCDGTLPNHKTIIESSSGSTRTGSRKGKEHWEHTKKWSQGFLEVYNTEKDPEVKSIMKDFGKDLDKWITEKDVQEAADLMTQIPKRKKKYIEKKVEKLKREMQMFGPQAVVSKYREYGEEKEEDYFWWLDLSFVLCIELYRVQDGLEEVGFYSLEMAQDLELKPKPRHVIAFEDPSDAKNFCIILQTHLEILGTGNAFVVAQPPKDAFRNAKANGFSVTVIRKGQLQLNVDQRLEEVDNEIVEIGSKMYHDQIMRDRSVDMSSLIKGVLGSQKSNKR